MKIILGSMLRLEETDIPRTVTNTPVADWLRENCGSETVDRWIEAVSRKESENDSPQTRNIKRWYGAHLLFHEYGREDPLDLPNQAVYANRLADILKNRREDYMVSQLLGSLLVQLLYVSIGKMAEKFPDGKLAKEYWQIYKTSSYDALEGGADYIIEFGDGSQRLGLKLDISFLSDSEDRALEAMAQVERIAHQTSACLHFGQYSRTKTQPCDELGHTANWNTILTETWRLDGNFAYGFMKHFLMLLEAEETPPSVRGFAGANRRIVDAACAQAIAEIDGGRDYHTCLENRIAAMIPENFR